MTCSVAVWTLVLAPITFGQSFTGELKGGAVTDVKGGAAPAEKASVSVEVRGDISMARKDYRQAIELYQSQQPTTAVLQNKIGIAHHQMMDLDSARKYYQIAIRMNPDYAEAVNNLGTIYYVSKSYRKAVRQYQRALDLAPQSASIYSNLGTAWFARKNYKKAIEAYQKAVALDPEVFEHRSSNGVLLQERSIAERAKFHYYLAKTYAKSGQTERALQYMRKALEEGFKERNKFREDPEFASLQQLPEFEELMQYQPRVL